MLAGKQSHPQTHKVDLKHLERPNAFVFLVLCRRYIWRTYHLVFQGEKLDDDRMRLKE